MQHGVLSHPCTGILVDFSFFLQEHLLKCALAARHEGREEHMKSGCRGGGEKKKLCRSTDTYLK